VKPHLVGDLAFLLEPVHRERVHNDHVELKSLPPEYIGASISQLFASTIVRMNPTWPDINSFYSAFAETLDRVGERLDLPVVFIPHVIIPNNDDRKAAGIVSKLMQREAVELTDAYHADEIKTVIAQSSFFIGCRMHALIAALSSRIPTVALGYSPKMVEVIYKYLPYEYAIDLRNTSPEVFASNLDIMIADMVSDRSGIINRLDQAIDKMAVQSSKNFHVLDEMIIKRMAK
jgi:polysaccharide pyruvyl transferase WcaK-like protein